MTATPMPRPTSKRSMPAEMLTNSGAVTAIATGGTADANEADTDTYAESYGLYVGGGITNTGALTVTATGGDATVTGDDAETYAYAYGAYSYSDVNDLTNSGGRDRHRHGR